MVFLKGSNKARFGSLLVDWLKAYTNNQHNLYPTDLTSIVDIMRIVPQKKKKYAPIKNEKGTGRESEENLEEASFAYTGKGGEHPECHCCGGSIISTIVRNVIKFCRRTG